MLAAVVLVCAGVTTACDRADVPSDPVAQYSDDTGRFEIVRERAAPDGRLEIRVRAENLDQADRIARKLVATKKSSDKKIALVEFIGMRDAEDAPSRRQVANP
jgi:hypothetical protein